ncbi:uncharacterized protein LOC127837146 [Dreissena polymorpha]|uniref:uncharacterized protein LOC127837146 n=1 Tax=Dreissena polymorpha TaxID=45954 RepID=UPI0022646CA2|nr:uncharacterized protein LOC127837146 [Dreissena polymorpha]
MNNIILPIVDVQRGKQNGNLDVSAARTQIASLLTNLQRLENDHTVPDDLLKSTIQSVVLVRDSLPDLTQHAQHSSHSVDRYEDTVPNPHGRGRDLCDIDISKLQQLIDMGYTVKEIAEKGLLEYNRDHPNSGSAEVHAYLKTRGISIKRERCREMLRNVDASGTALRWSATIQRRKYSVPTANSVWHLDTHHSLIRWGIVVHGGIDGHSRLVSFLRAATCNTSKAAASFFLQSVKAYGFPSRVRVDNGTEYGDIGRLMISVNGDGRGSFLTGPSVHNQRIERLWRDVFTKVLDTFYKLFHYMEERQLLNVNDKTHRWVLQYVFVPIIDRALRQWMETHNTHKIRTENNRTPNMMWFQSLVQGDSQRYTSVRNIEQPPNEAVSDAIRDLQLSEDDTTYLVPRDPCPLSQHNFQQLQTTIAINRNSTSHGLDIFGDVMQFVLAHPTEL